MKRKALRVILTWGMIAVFLIGCSENIADSMLKKSSVRDGADDEDVQVVTVWSDNAHEQSVREAQIEEFNNTIGKQEGIRIDYTVYGTDYADVINVALMANEGPDLFRPLSNTFAENVNAGYAVPISELEGSDSLLSRYDKEDLLIGDQVFGGISIYPKTWDDVRKDAKLITDVSNGDAYGYFLAFQSGWTIDHYIYSVSSASLGHFGYDAVSGTYRYSDGLPIIENILGMIEDGSVFPGYENMDADTARAQFSAGKVGIVMAACFDVAVYTEQFPAKCNWVVCDPPSIDSSGYPYKEMVTPVDLLAVAKKSLEAKDTSKIARVLEWFYADENLVEMYEKGMYLPYRKEVLDMAGESKVKGLPSR